MELNENWIEAGKIAGKSMSYGKGLIKIGKSYLETVNKIEDKIRSLGGLPGFPVTLSVNEIAAHYTPGINDELKFNKEDLVKLDVGVQINGYVGDTACTIDLGNNSKLVKASEEALKKALEIVRPGLEIWEIGKVIERVITDYGYLPIKNLSGHSIEQYKEHAGINIPNFDNGDATQLEEGQVIAIEPFATDGIGLIDDKKDSGIYMLNEGRQVRDRIAREILDYIKNEFRTLPFAGRWLTKKFPEFKSRYALRVLVKEEVIHEYKQLVEKENGLVSQAEHTIFVSDKPIVITKKQ